MHYHSNHMWCNASNWEGLEYTSRHTVSIKKWNNYDLSIPHHQQEIDEDWSNLIDPVRVIDYTELERLKQQYAELKEDFPEKIKLDEVDFEELAKRDCPTPHQAVIDWLNELPPSTSRDRQDLPQAWCIGDVDYRLRESNQITFWFLRKRDAMRFIEKWSVHKQPTTYFDYFREDRRELRNGRLLSVVQY